MTLSIYTYSNLLEEWLQDLESSDDEHPLSGIKVFDPLSPEDQRENLYRIWQGLMALLSVCMCVCLLISLPA